MSLAKNPLLVALHQTPVFEALVAAVLAKDDFTELLVLYVLRCPDDAKCMSTFQMLRRTANFHSSCTHAPHGIYDYLHFCMYWDEWEKLENVEGYVETFQTEPCEVLLRACNDTIKKDVPLRVLHMLKKLKIRVSNSRGLEKLYAMADVDAVINDPTWRTVAREMYTSDVAVFIDDVRLLCQNMSRGYGNVKAQQYFVRRFAYEMAPPDVAFETLDEQLRIAFHFYYGNV